MDGWYVGSNLQVEAVLRLLYYYPKETAPLIAARLRSFDVSDTGGVLERWTKREARNGVRTDEFIKAVRWSREPVIRDALAGLARRASDRGVIAALGGGAERGTRR
jgi:hypothetical protein